MNLFRKLAARLALALIPILPASQAPVTDPATREKTKAVRADEFDASEVETGCSPVIFTDSNRYSGERTGIDAQLEALMKASGKGRRFLNASLMGEGLCEERKRFVAERTRYIG